MRSTGSPSPALLPLTLDELSADADAARQIIERVDAAEVQGLGGGGYPTARKLARGANVSALIINGMQSEPDNASDLGLLKECTDDVLNGLVLVAIATGTGAATITLALPDTIERSFATQLDQELATRAAWLEQRGRKNNHIRQNHLPPDPASGEEHQLALALGLIAELTPAVAAAPLVEQGVLCINLATAYAIARAVLQGEPLTRRMVTLNGAPRWLRIGTPIASVANPAWINGSHSGAPAQADDVVGPGTFCISPPPDAPEAPCINCGACAPVCPRALQPQELFRTIELGDAPLPTLKTLKLDDCIECGACNAVCPSKLWLTQSFRHAKSTAATARRREALATKAKTRVAAREQRLQRIKAERATRLSQRADTQRRAW